MKRSGSKVDDPQSGDKQVKQAYAALPKSEVPSELDAKVLARAREAADKTNKVVSLQRALRRWAIPLSTAASVIVVMSVVYQMQFNTPHHVEVNRMDLPAQEAAAVLAEDQAPAKASAAPAAPAAKSATHAKQRAAAGSITPPPVIVGPANSPVMVGLPESLAPAPPPEIIMPASPASSEAVAMANEARLEKKEQESKTLESLAKQDSAKFASGQLAGMTARRADAMADAEVAKPQAVLSLAAQAVLAPLVGHYKYESYRIIHLSGEMFDLKKLGYTAATLDIDAKGALTRRMTLEDGSVVTQTARVLEVKLDDHSGSWTVLWADIAYPVESTLAFDASKLTSRLQFEYLADAVRFGNVELATLRRVAQ